MADSNADIWTNSGTEVVTNPDTIDVTDGLEAVASSAGMTMSSKLKFKTEVVPVASFTDNADATGTFATSISIPEGAVVAQSFIDQVVGFAGDTSAVVTIGDGTDVDRYNTGTPSVFATADHVSAGAVSGTAYHSAAKTVTLIVTGASDFGLIVTDGNGSLRVTVAYYQSV